MFINPVNISNINIVHKVEETSRFNSKLNTYKVFSNLSTDQVQVKKKDDNTNSFSAGINKAETLSNNSPKGVQTDTGSILNTNKSINDPPGWQEFLQEIKKIKKEDLLPSPDSITNTEILSSEHSKPLKKAIIVISDNNDDGVNLAINDLKKYLESVTGQPTEIIKQKSGENLELPENLSDITLIAIGNGKAIQNLIPPVSGHPEGYSIQARQINIKGKNVDLVSINGDDKNGMQYGIYRLMQLSGKRFFNYMDAYTPSQGKAIIPTNNFSEIQYPTDKMKVRGFAPHTYHPIPLSFALHQPSAEHLEMMKKYIDWSIQNGQNFLMFPMLELDNTNKYIPMKNGDKNFRKWIPYAREIVDYAHQRGIKISIKLAFANYVSTNTYAINPFEAIFQSFKLDSKTKDIKKITEIIENEKQKLAEIIAKFQNVRPDEIKHLHEKEQQIKGNIFNLNKKLNKENQDYKKLFEKYSATDKQKINSTIDNFMQVPWDEIDWNLGTSEFSSTNDDLTIQWMNDAASYIKEKYPNTTTGARSHIPSRPKSEKYNESYFNLIRFSDPSVANYAHTTELYSLTDPAPVYGNQNFEDKLKYLFRSTPERKDVYYPETSYWVAYDVSVPLFLPVYMLNRKHDMEIVKKINNVDGQIDFTTAWEWGYWLNDYVMAKMQSNPDKNLTEIIDGAFTIFEGANKPMTNIMLDTMKEQQKFLIDKGLMRDVQGFSPLTDFGASIKDIPVLNKLIEGSNSTPVRLKPSTIMNWNKNKIEKFENGELKALEEMTDSFENLYNRSESLQAQIPAQSKRYYDEIVDGLQVNYLRTKQSQSLFKATIMARQAELEKNPQLKEQGKLYLDEANKAVDSAMLTIKKRESNYRDKPEYTYQEGKSPTIWNNRYLTPVHTGEYWKRSSEEVEKLYKKKSLLNDLNEWLFKHKPVNPATVSKTKQ